VNRLRQQPPSPGNIKIADEGSCPSLRAVLGLKANDVCHLLDMTSMVQVGRLPLEVMHEFKQTYLYALTGVCNLPIRSRSAASSKLANSSEDSRGALSHMARRAGLTMPGLPGEAAHGADDLPAAARAVIERRQHADTQHTKSMSAVAQEGTHTWYPRLTGEVQLHYLSSRRGTPNSYCAPMCSTCNICRLTLGLRPIIR
jgi:hypothetical protein